MKIQWFHHIKDETLKQKFKEDFGNFINGPFVKRLHDLIEQELKDLEASELNIEDYKDTSWSHRQAHINGARQALKHIKELISV